MTFSRWPFNLEPRQMSLIDIIFVDALLHRRASRDDKTTSVTGDAETILITSLVTTRKSMRRENFNDVRDSCNTWLLVHSHIYRSGRTRAIITNRKL